jgi:hypothetical protein
MAKKRVDVRSRFLWDAPTRYMLGEIARRAQRSEAAVLRAWIWKVAGELRIELPADLRPGAQGPAADKAELQPAIPLSPAAAPSAPAVARVADVEGMFDQLAHGE